MPAFSLRRHPVRHCVPVAFALALLPLAALALLALPAQAAGTSHDDHGSHGAQAKPAVPVAAHAPEPAAKSAPQDPMDRLREKLAAKLGATKAPEAKSPYVVRVVSRNTPDAARDAADAQGHGSSHGAADAGPGPAKARSAERHAQAQVATISPDAARLAAAHRASKASAGAHGESAGDAHGLVPAGGHAAHWTYDGATGPQAWAELKPEFATCGKGQRQSPIDIRGGVRVELEPIKFDYRPTGFAVIDNGHTVQVNLGTGNSIEVMGRRFELLQFHFHRPSEERIDGRQFDMVAHLVHKDLEGRLAVVAVLLDRGSAHPLVQTVWNNLPLEKGDEVRASGAMDVAQLLPQDRRYYTYMGSLTTPPCTEGVLWMVMAQPVPLSAEQIAVFGHLYPMNARPIQSASGRLIKRSN